MELSSNDIPPVSNPQQNPTVRIRGRVRSGCLTCRSRKVKCDETRPTCRNCTRLSRTCIYKDVPRRRKSPKSVASNSPSTTSHLGITTMVETSPLTDPYISQIFQEQDFFCPPSFDFNNADLLQSHVFPPIEDMPLQSAFGVDPTIFGQWEDPFAQVNGSDSLESSYDLTQVPENGTLIMDSPPAQTAKFSYFENHVEPPFITPCDSINWVRMRRYITELGSHNSTVAAAIVAVETLYQAETEEKDTGQAMGLYFTAKSHYSKMLDDQQQDLHTILVVTFLLCCFEISAQTETISITLQREGPFVKKLENWANHGKWPPISRRIEAWLRILHAKAMHLGGRGLLSVKVNELLPIDNHPTLSLSLLDYTADPAAALYDSISSPLFDFFYALQKISIEASSLNRHHRSRYTPADEAEVKILATTIRTKLHALWSQRTSLLRVDASTLHSLLSPPLSKPLTTLIGICTASYYTEHIYLGRSFGETLTATVEAQNCMQQVRRIVDTSSTSSTGKLNSGYLWPLYMYAAETMDVNDARWAVSKLRMIGNRVCHSDFVADLADKLSEEQIRKGERVDTRYLCLENFGVPPPFV